MRTTNKAITTCLMGLSLMAASWSFPAVSSAATVSQLDISGGSITLNFGNLGNLAGSFTENGQLLMNQFQPAPNVLDPITISHLTFSIFTGSGGTLNLPAPTAQTSGATMTANLHSLFADVTSTGWAGLLTSPPSPVTTSLHVGGLPSREFRRTTMEFVISNGCCHEY